MSSATRPSYEDLTRGLINTDDYRGLSAAYIHAYERSVVLPAFQLIMATESTIRALPVSERVPAKNVFVLALTRVVGQFRLTMLRNPAFRGIAEKAIRSSIASPTLSNEAKEAGRQVLALIDFINEGHSLEEVMMFGTANNTRILNTRPMYPDGPKECFNPFMASMEDINDGHVLFYIFKDSQTLASVACIDGAEELNGQPLYKKFLHDKTYLYHRCKPTVPAGAISVSREEVEPEPLQRLAFDRNVYVPAWQAKKIQAGRRYALVPSERSVGRIVSEALLATGEAVSAEHCQTEYTDKIHDVYEMVASGGGVGFRKMCKVRRTRRNRNRGKKTRGHKRG